MEESHNIFRGLKKTLKAKCFKNPRIRVVSKLQKPIYELICNSTEDNDKLREIDSFTEPISRIEGRYLEIFRGYRRI